MKTPKEIKHHWGRRAWSTGKIATSAIRLAGRGLLKRSNNQQDGHLGELLAKEMDEMKGLAMKIGQILSYFDGVLPPETHRALQKLQKGAQPIAFSSIQQVIEEAFQRSLSELFESIDPKPVAAASIGQVHRGLYQGQEVAIKVQYPHVQKTFESDFTRLSKIAGMASLVTAVDGKAIAEDLQKRIVDECDYLLEAKNQHFFRKAFVDTPEISIPEIIDQRSTQNVLCSQWINGMDFYSFIESSTQEQRNQAALILSQFAWRSFFNLGFLNADPHPGNYLFPPDQRVVFLDFGCVRHFSTDYIEKERQLARCVIHGQRHKFRQAVLDTGMVPKAHKFNFDAHWEMMRHQYQPYSQPNFYFDFDYIKKGADFSRPDNPNLRRIAIPPPWIWHTRLLWGLHAVLARMQANGNFAEIFCQALEQPLQRNN